MVDVTADQTQIASHSGGKALPALLRGVSLETVNRILIILTVLAGIYFGLTLVFGGIKLAGVKHHIRGLEAKGAAAEPTVEMSAPRVAAVDPALSNRNIFQPAGAVASGDGGASVVSVSSSYRLVGIAAAADPSDTYVMVENTQTKLTYFLQYRQPVEGLELERILEDKVIVKIGGKSVELE